MRKRELSVFDKHQLRIARDTLKMADAAVHFMGGPTKKEAREIILRLTGRAWNAGVKKEWKGFQSTLEENPRKNPADKPHPRSAYAHLPLRGRGLEGADPVRKSHLTAAEKKLLGSRPLKFSHDDEQEWKALEQAREDLLRSYRTKYEGPTRSSRPHSESAGADLPMYGIEHGGGTVEQIKRRAERLWKNNPRKTARRVIERRIVKRFVQDAIKAGYRLAVSLERGYDVEEMLLGSVNVSAIMAEAFAGDEAHIFVQPEKGPTVEDGAVVSTGWVYIVFGNEGWDVIADYTTNLESVLAGANKLAESLE